MTKPPVAGGYRPSAPPAFREKLGLPSPSTGRTPTPTTTYNYQGKSYSSQESVMAAMQQNIIANLPASKQQQLQQPQQQRAPSMGIFTDPKQGLMEQYGKPPSPEKGFIEKGMAAVEAGRAPPGAAGPITAEDLTNVASFGVGGIAKKGMFAVGKQALGARAAAWKGGKEVADHPVYALKKMYDGLTWRAKQMLDPNIMTGDVGKVASGKIGMLIGQGTGGSKWKLALNTVTASKTASYLAKLAKATTHPMVVLGIVGTIAYTSTFWGPNEKGDALQGLGIIAGSAAKIGNVSLVDDIGLAIQEAYDINANMPIIGFGKAEKAKYKFALLAYETNRQLAIANIKEDEYWAAKGQGGQVGMGDMSHAEGIPSAGDVQEREYWEQQRTERGQEESMARETEAADWDKRQADIAAVKEEERAYWEAQRKLEEAKTAEDRAYWEKVSLEKKQAWEDSKKSTLGFGLL